MRLGILCSQESYFKMVLKVAMKDCGAERRRSNDKLDNNNSRLVKKKEGKYTNMVQMFIKLLDESNITLQISSKTSVQHLKKLIKSKCKSDSYKLEAEFYLSNCVKIFRDSTYLEDYDIKKYCTITFLGKIKGGMYDGYEMIDENSSNPINADIKTFDQLQSIGRPSTTKKMMHIKKKNNIDLPLSLNSLQELEASKDSKTNSITFALPFGDTIQEQLQNNLLLKNDNIIHNQVHHLKKEILNIKEVVNMDMEAAFAIIRKMTEWGCVINSGVNMFSEKINCILNSIAKLEMSQSNLHQNELNQISYDNIIQGMSNHLTSLDNNLSANLDSKIKCQFENLQLNQDTKLQENRQELSRTLENKLDEKIKIIETNIKNTILQHNTSIEEFSRTIGEKLDEKTKIIESNAKDTILHHRATIEESSRTFEKKFEERIKTSEAYTKGTITHYNMVTEELSRTFEKKVDARNKITENNTREIILNYNIEFQRELVEIKNEFIQKKISLK